jgi:hypothetical protein
MVAWRKKSLQLIIWQQALLQRSSAYTWRRMEVECAPSFRFESP